MQNGSNPPSTRRVTKASGKYTRATAGSRSLERGLELLRAFQGGAPSLTNAELAKRTGLARPTVSRLSRSLVEAGFLEHDSSSGAYLLAPVHLSLALAFRQARSELSVAASLMREAARMHGVNVGLAAADGLHMVYLETIRQQGSIVRQAGPGSRLALEDASPGLAWLAAQPVLERDAVLARLAQARGARWPDVRTRIEEALALFAQEGYCRSDVLTGLTGVAMPLASGQHTVYAVNVSFATPAAGQDVEIARSLSVLRGLVADIARAWHTKESA